MDIRTMSYFYRTSKDHESLDDYSKYLDRQKADFERTQKLREESVPVILDLTSKLNAAPRKFLIRATKYPKLLLDYSNSLNAVILITSFKGAPKFKADIWAVEKWCWKKAATYTSKDLDDFVNKYNDLLQVELNRC